MAEQDGIPYEPRFTPTDRSSPQNVVVHTSDSARNFFQQQGNKVDVSLPVKEASLSKQTSLLHQSSTYLKQATSGFMRWQSRRAFWSTVDQPGQQSPSGSSLVNWFKTVAEVSRRQPLVLLLPLLLLGGCIAGGVAGVTLAARLSEQRARDDTATLAWQAASLLELVLDTRALQPVAALASLAREQPSAATLSLAMPALLLRLFGQTTPTAMLVLQELLLAPFGSVNASFSLQPAVGDSAFPIGSSIFARDGAPLALALAVQKRLPVVATKTAVTAKGLPDVHLAVYHPVYVAGVAADETWGNAVSEDYLNRICPSAPTACYDSGSETKLWGFAVAVASLGALANGPDSGLQSLVEGDYQYRLSVLPSGGADWVNLAVSQPPLRVRGDTAAVPVRLAGPKGGSAVAASGATEAELLVDHDDGWQITWEGPLIATVVAASLGLSAFIFVMLFNYWRHMGMLQAMLPAKVIRVLGTGSNYYQHFDCVTVLYADVVRYTTAKPPQGDTVPTLEIVKLLNDVHTMYESIIEKWGLFRIRRSGESFLCVGGCPTPDDPVVVAVRVASCARDLVLATSRFRGAGGFRVQIRVGLHSGPAVAAVVGSKMPRFSLFGDVVDVAYYMEATSRVMAIHVSERTSQLLTTANDPLLQLSPRGRLDILGEGSMDTSWLRLDALPDPDTSAGRHDATGIAVEALEAQPEGSARPERQQQQPQGCGSQGAPWGGDGRLGRHGGSSGGGASSGSEDV